MKKKIDDILQKIDEPDVITDETSLPFVVMIRDENTLKKLFEKGNNSPKYIKKSVYQNKGYQGLPLTSPGFQEL